METNSKSTILVVEDDPVGRKVLETILVKDGYKVAVADNGIEALEILKNNIPDMILTDIMMPQMDGFTLCQKLRSDPVLAEIPILMVTALQDKNSRLKGLQVGADDFISKPYDSAELKVRVNSITKLNRYKRLLGEREKFQSIVELLPDGILIINRENDICQANTAMSNIFGAEGVNNIIGQAINTYIISEQIEYFNSYLKKILNVSATPNRTGLRFEVICKKTNGAEFPAEVSIGHFNYEGQPAALLIIRDITERKQAEEKIYEQAALLDKAQDAVIGIDLENRINYWNPAASDLYKKNLDEVMGQDVGIIINLSKHSDYEKAHNTVRQKGSWNGTFKHSNPGSQNLIIESRWSLIHDNKGKPKSILIIDRDITEKVKLEEQFLRAQRMESIGALASGIAHDLNNILSPIMLTAQLIRMQSGSDKNSSMLDSLETNAQRGANLVKQILSFARGMSSEKLVIQMRHIINDIKKISRETFPKSIEIQTDLPRELWLVYGDPTQLDQVFMNLCVNARDAMPNGGVLKISAENIKLDKSKIQSNGDIKGTDFILFSVADTGTGIPKDLLKKIFEPFFTTKEIGKGTGLGLSTVSTIVKEHGGFIEVDSESGKGTLFKIYLPAIQSTALMEVGDKQPELLTGNNELILVVDDESSIQEITKTILETYNYKVITANDGSEALRIFNENKDSIKIVLLDMIMPVMDGPMCLKGLRQISSSIKVIGTTGHAESEQYLNMVGPMVQSFLSKPFTPANLLKVLNKVLSE